MWTSRALASTKGVVAMKTAIRYRPLIALAVACAMPRAAHAVTRTYADVPGPVVRGLHATLRALRVHASASRTVVHTPGGFVKAKLVVDACTGAAQATWSCTARLTTTFRYAGSTSPRGAAGGPSTRVVGESLLVSFDADR